MIVKVQYRSEYTGKYVGRAYAYKTELDVSVGDIVTAPTYKGDSPARVCETHIVASALQPELLAVLKEITKFYEGGQNNDNI